MFWSIVILILLIPSICIGAPSKPSLSGTLSDGQTLTITGSSFGSTGPTITIFDDFEKGTNGNSIATGAGSAQVGQWDAIGAYSSGIKYSNAYKHSGSIAYMTDFSSDSGAEGNRHVEINSLGGTTQIYLSWWVYIPTGVNVPGTEQGEEDPGGGPNWKTFWLYADPFPASDIVSTYITNSLPSEGTWFVGFLDDTNNPQRLDSGWDYDPSFIKGQWSRWEVYAVGNTSSGILQFWETNATHARYNLVNLSGGPTIHTGEEWDILHFPGYGRGDPHSQTYTDDIYVATGAGARARVEIGNASTYATCTNLAIFTPTAWADGSITATMRSGSFTSGTVYLYVVDANGDVSSASDPLTIGDTYGDADDTTPDQFTFTDITSATLSTLYTSNTITVLGIDSAAVVTITGGEYSKNAGEYTSSAGTAVLNDTFAVRQTSSGSYSTTTNTTLTIGGVSDTYSVTTLAGVSSIKSGQMPSGRVQ